MMSSREEFVSDTFTDGELEYFLSGNSQTWLQFLKDDDPNKISDLKSFLPIPKPPESRRLYELICGHEEHTAKKGGGVDTRTFTRGKKNPLAGTQFQTKSTLEATSPNFFLSSNDALVTDPKHASRFETDYFRDLTNSGIRASPKKHKQNEEITEPPVSSLIENVNMDLSRCSITPIESSCSSLVPDETFCIRRSKVLNTSFTIKDAPVNSALPNVTDAISSPLVSPSPPIKSSGSSKIRRQLPVIHRGSQYPLSINKEPENNSKPNAIFKLSPVLHNNSDLHTSSNSVNDLSIVPTNLKKTCSVESVAAPQNELRYRTVRMSKLAPRYKSTYQLETLFHPENNLKSLSAQDKVEMDAKTGSCSNIPGRKMSLIPKPGSRIPTLSRHVFRPTPPKET